jgi:hypothetical protein
MTWPEFVHNIGKPFHFPEWNGPFYCEISRYGAHIVCRGADCLPPQEPQVDVAAYLKCEAEIKERVLQEVLSPKITTLEELRAHMQQEYLAKCDECYDDGEAVPLEKRLSITDQSSKYYMDIGDDIVMSVFGKTLRSPLDG